MNLSTPQPEGCGLPSIRDFGESFDPELLKTEGLEVHPEPRSSISRSTAGLHAAERVKTHSKCWVK